MTPPPNPQHSLPAHSVGGNLQSLWKCGTNKRVNCCVLDMLSWSRKVISLLISFIKSPAGLPSIREESVNVEDSMVWRSSSGWMWFRHRGASLSASGLLLSLTGQNEKGTINTQIIQTVKVKK